MVLAGSGLCLLYGSLITTLNCHLEIAFGGLHRDRCPHHVQVMVKVTTQLQTSRNVKNKG
uniref:Uncharacterized protein n=1 Tax=Setaria viridis TaxID=4556 RepID=A0A4U6W822_SETVI|nr:hypothetical protein SEVIR_1G140732v2 [Setaria viridis]